MQRNVPKKEFVKNITENLKFFKEWHNKNTNGLVDLEDQRSISELEALLKSSEESTILATFGTLKPFFTYLRNREKRIKDSDADYLHAPGTVSDAICKYLAEQLAFYTNENAISLLISTVDGKANAHVNLAKLGAFVLSDDGRQLLNSNTYARRLKNQSLSSLNQDYSDAEKIRLANKSAEIANRFNQEVDKNVAEGYSLVVPRRKARFMRYLNSVSVPGALDNERNARLRKEIHPVIETFAQLCDVMRDYSLQGVGSLLDSFSLDEMRKLLLNGKKFQAALQDQSLYVGDETHAKKVLQAFDVLYAKELSARNSSHKSTTGWLFGKPSKEVKKPAAELYRALLSSDDSLEVIDKKLDENKEHAAALNDTSFFGWGASDLAALRNQIKLVKNPTYREEQAPQKGWFGRA